MIAVQFAPTIAGAWKKLHLGVGESTGENVAASAPDKSVTNAHERPGLLEQVAEPIQRGAGDPAHAPGRGRQTLRDRGAPAMRPRVSTRRSLAETAGPRLGRLLGAILSARSFSGQ